MAYTKHGRGAAGVGSARRFGDFGIEQLRIRDAKIIDNLKLAKAQETERSQNLISQQKDVDRTELGVEEDIQQLIQDRYQNALAATKLRGRQEGQKGRDQARMIKEDAQPIIDMWQKIAGAGGNIFKAKVEKDLSDWRQDRLQENYKNTVDAQDVAIKDIIAKYQFKEDISDAEQIKHLSAYIANQRIAGTPSLYAGRAIGGSAMALTDRIDLIQARAINQLIQAGIEPNAANVKQYLGLRFKSIGQAYNLIDANGEWKSNKHVLDLQRAWNKKTSQIALNFNNAEVQRLNTQNYNTQLDELSNSPTVENAFKAAVIYTFKPLEKDHKSFHNMADGWLEVATAMAKDTKISKQQALFILNQPWLESKRGKDFGQPNKAGESLAKKHRGLVDHYLKENTKFVKQRKANLQAAKTKADLDDNRKILKKYLFDTPYEGQNLDAEIEEAKQKHGDHSETVTTLKKFQYISKQNWDLKKQKEYLQQAIDDKDIEAILDYARSQSYTNKELIEYNKKTLPDYVPLMNNGFNPKKHWDKLKATASEKLDFQSAGPNASNTPETLDEGVHRLNIRWHQKIQELTTGTVLQKASHPKGSISAQTEAYTYIEGLLEDGKNGKGEFAISSSGDRSGAGPAEFKLFLAGGGQAWVDSDKFSMSNNDYNALRAKVGNIEAIKSKGVFSREHLLYVQSRVAAGKTFEPIPITRNVRDGEEVITSREIYQHHLDELGKEQGLESKLIVPEDFMSTAQKDPFYDAALKRTLANIKTSSGFWRANTMVAEGGTRPKDENDPRINFSVKAGLMEAIQKNTSTVETGRTTVNTNNTLTFESPFAADSLSYFGTQGLNMIEVQTLPNYYGDTIQAAGSAQDWLFNSGQTDWYFIPGEVPGLPGSWRYRD